MTFKTVTQYVEAVRLYGQPQGLLRPSPLVTFF
jgi:hypothetical protein